MAAWPTTTSHQDRREISRTLTWLLSGMAGAFLLQFGAELAPLPAHGGVADLLALSRANLAAGRFWTLLTHGFLHSTTNLLHVATSLAGIFLLGRELERTYGTRLFLFVLGSSILAGGLVWLSTTPTAVVSHVGATAGVYGLLAFFALAEPHKELRFLFLFAFPLRFRPRQLLVLVAGVDAIGLLLIDLLQRPWPFEYTPAAHLAGLATGWACFRFLPQRVGNSPRERDNRPNLAIPPERSSVPAVRPDNATAERKSPQVGLRQEVDRILDKINRDGLAALTETERRTLDNARDLLNRR